MSDPEKVQADLRMKFVDKLIKVASEMRGASELSVLMARALPDHWQTVQRVTEKYLKELSEKEVPE